MTCVDAICNIVGDSVFHYKDSSSPGLYERVRRSLKPRVSPLIMEEDGKGATLTKVYLTGLCSGSLVLKPDNFGINYYKKGTWNRECDYLILTKYQSTDYALFVELKSSLQDQPNVHDKLLVVQSKEDIRKAEQIEGTCVLFDFLCFAAKRKFGVLENDNFMRKKIVLYESIKPRTPLQSNMRLSTNVQQKSQDILTMQVNDFATLSIDDLIEL